MSQITPDSWIERSDYDQPPNPDDACMVCDRIDCVCPSDEAANLEMVASDSVKTSNNKMPVVPNESTETDGAL